MKEKLQKEIGNLLKDLGVAEPKVALEYPAHIEKGDLSTNVAMAHAKELGKKPLDLAQEIAAKISLPAQAGLDGVRAEAVAPGFLNFFFDAAYFNAAIRKPFEKGTIFSGQKTIVEYTDPNPFKEFHIGHLMPNVIGESISRIIEANGAEVKRANYQGDVGLHVAKAVWAIKNGADLSAAYAQGHKAYEEGGVAKDEIIEINKKIYDKSDPAINDIYEEGRQKSLLYFEVLYKILGTTFDYYFFESEVADFGKETVEKNVGTVFEKGEEGAVVFRGESFDKKLHTRVFINKDGLPTYEAKELGLAKVKYDRFAYDTSIVVTANEINEYFKVLLKAMSLVFPELAAKTKHISHGILKLPTGKMSSRTGTVITAESLLSQIKEKVKDRVDDAKIVEEIAVGAVKYSILRQAVGSDIIFDFDKSISFEGDSGPYLQYSTVRARSLLVKAEGNVEVSENLPDGWQTMNLERLLERFPAIVERAGREYSPSQLVTYLTELAGEFNSFYNSGKIIDAENAAVSGYKLALTKTFADVMEKGLDLLGIKVPEKM